MNVIICGDFHQFKPVISKKTAPLYWPSNPSTDTVEESTGSEVYSEFKTVVFLTHQIHVQDEEWTNFLCHSHHGKCMKEQLCMLHGLVLGSTNCPETNGDDNPWRDTVLVTAHHAVQIQWNKHAMQLHCHRTGSVLY